MDILPFPDDMAKNIPENSFKNIPLDLLQTGTEIYKCIHKVPSFKYRIMFKWTDGLVELINNFWNSPKDTV